MTSEPLDLDRLERQHTDCADEGLCEIPPLVAEVRRLREQLDMIRNGAAGELLDTTRRAERAEAEVEQLHSWGGLLELLDEHWPADIFPVPEGLDAAKSTTRRDTGPIVLGLIRWVDRLSAERAEAQAAVERVRKLLDTLDDFDPGDVIPTSIIADDLRRALDAEEVASDGE